MSRVEFRIDNYRRFKRVRWSLPEGVSLLVGPNGSGKSTLLSCPQFMSDYLNRDLDKAIEFSGGGWGLRNLRCDPTEQVRFSLEIANLRWETHLKGTPDERLPQEEAWVGAEQVLEQRPAADQLRYRGRDVPVGFGAALAKASGVFPEARTELGPVLDALGEYRLYSTPDVRSLRDSGSPEGADRCLHPTGKNAFAVLRNWKSGTREDQARYAYVEAELREAFPKIFTSFVLRQVARTVVAEFYHPDHRELFPFSSAPSGLVIGLLHLMAIASAPRGGIVAIDEFENGLHPAAIRSLIEALRVRAAEEHLVVLLASHSFAVINEFQDEKENVFVLELDQGEGEWPIRLVDHIDPDWLAHFSLGDRYGRDFAKQDRSRP